jgi:hypothetical protein
MSVATITTPNTSTITAADWSPQEISSMDAMVSSPSSDDLFDGDILGDELMDIYNAAVVGGGDDDEDMNGKLCIYSMYMMGLRHCMHDDACINCVISFLY